LEITGPTGTFGENRDYKTMIGKPFANDSAHMSDEWTVPLMARPLAASLRLFLNSWRWKKNNFKVRHNIFKALTQRFSRLSCLSFYYFGDRWSYRSCDGCMYVDQLFELLLLHYLLLLLVLLNSILRNNADMHQVSEVLIVIQRIADNELVWDLETHVIWGIPRTERSALTQ